MIKLSKERDTQIRNKLDEIGHCLYHDIAPFEDLCWTYATIKELLYIIDEQQRELKHIGDTS